MKYKFTPDGELTPEKELTVSVDKIDEIPKEEKLISITATAEEISRVLAPQSHLELLTNDLAEMVKFFKRVKKSNNENFYEMVASDEDIFDFITKIQVVRLWLEFRDYIDEVYGERCVYLDWAYDFKKGHVRAISIDAYDKNNKRIQADLEEARLEMKWLGIININLAYAYNISPWERDNMNMGQPR